jgi:hypothetical protein
VKTSEIAATFVPVKKSSCQIAIDAFDDVIDDVETAADVLESSAGWEFEDSVDGLEGCPVGLLETAAPKLERLRTQVDLIRDQIDRLIERADELSDAARDEDEEVS